MRPLARVAALMAAVAVTVVTLAAPAQASPRVTITNAAGTAQADSTYSTTVSVSGAGFQSVKGGFGGIYVFFGWVDDPSGGSWRPSKGGATGADYLYVPDSESKDNGGFQRFVAFPGSDTASSANGGTVKADGTWSTKLTIPGPTFQAADRSGKVVEVDCRTKPCGVITIGAHGVVNPSNESFTRVTFADLSAAEPAATTAQTAAAAPTGAPAAVAEKPSVASTVPATLGVDQTTIVVGRVLGFMGQGFTPGEQVLGSLVGGQAAVGPLTAGAQGEVAGVLQLPATLRAGTQALTLTGAASGKKAQVEFTAIADPVEAAAAANAQDEAGAGTSPVAIAVLVAALAMLWFVVAALVAGRRRRRAAAVQARTPAEARS
ncbi:hypothetical protein [Cellulomonas rhizosphaerae]|uniref:Htaa domain-containing protein n=1 Tax=Cellulomonas rhizosphaerae TaxID=2293719 RepID=A0A413RIC9_9CELL|nr:hypothetical protein [Cellulomonas rhizosphaerae]RHA38070.1 hypothetical protein D1825_15115 [Cellulomonas rhizosphaerae]